jgi:hypothetical protein
MEQEDTLDATILETLAKFSPEQTELIIEYLNEMGEHHKKAYMIAYKQLESSFNVMRTNGFKEWLHNKSK